MTPYPWANFWLLAVIAAIVGHALYLRSQGRLFLFDPLFTFWGGFYVCNIAQPLNYADIFVDWHGVEIFDKTLFYSFLGAVCVIKGYEMEVGTRIGRSLPRLNRRLDPDKFFLAGLIVAVLGIGDYYFLFQSAGGMWEWLGTARGGTDYTQVGGLVSTLDQLAPLGSYLMLTHVSMHPAGPVKKAFAYVFAALLWVWYLYLGTRSRVIGFALYALAAVFTPKRRNPALWFILPAFMALMVLTSFQEHYRNNFTDLSFNLDNIDMDEAKALCLPGFLGGDKDLKHKDATKGIDFNVDMTTVEVVPATSPYSYGWNFMEFITHWIPHSMWPDKRYPALESMQGVFQELTTNRERGTDLLDGPSITFLTFWYNVLGPLAVVLGGLFTGIMFRTMRTVADRDLGSEGDLVIYNTFLAIGFFESAQEPLSWIYNYIFVWIPILCVVYLCRANPEEGLFYGPQVTA